LSSDGQKELPIRPFPLKYVRIQSDRDRVVVEVLLRVVGHHPTAVERVPSFRPTSKPQPFGQRLKPKNAT
jgi:hypothetical protein